jgi:hypothetical protein
MSRRKTTRSIGRPGLALAAALLVGALYPATALAGLGELHMGSNPSVITAQSQTKQLEWKLGSYTVACTNATFEGKATALAVTELIATPTFSGCGNYSAAMNGCKYKFSGGVSKETANLSIVGCTANKTIEFTGMASGCVIKVGEQGSSAHVVYENVAGAPNHIVMNFTVSGLSYEEVGKFCADGNGTIGNNGTLNGSTTVKAYQLQEEKTETKHGHQYTEYVCAKQVELFAT